MEQQYYLRIEGDIFTFVVESIHPIKETDIKLTQEEYNKFFELQSEGKQFRLKDIATGITLFDFIEEYIPEPIEVKLELDAEDYLLDLEYRVSLIELGV